MNMSGKQVLYIINVHILNLTTACTLFILPSQVKMYIRGVVDSLTQRYAESSTLRILIRGVGDSPTQRYGELATPRITGAGSRRLSVSSIQRVFF